MICCYINNKLVKQYTVNVKNTGKKTSLITDKQLLAHINKIEFTSEDSLVILLESFKSCLPEFTVNENHHIEFAGNTAQFIAENLKT